MTKRDDLGDTSPDYGRRVGLSERVQSGMTAPDKEYRIEIQPWEYAFRVYEAGRGGMSYVASAVIQTYGCSGWVRHISNPLVLDLAVDRLDEILKAVGVDSLEGAMNPAMARALRIKARGKVKFTALKTCECAGRSMPWVRLERLDEKCDEPT